MLRGSEKKRKFIGGLHLAYQYGTKQYELSLAKANEEANLNLENNDQPPKKDQNHIKIGPKDENQSFEKRTFKRANYGLTPKKRDQYVSNGK